MPQAIDVDFGPPIISVDVEDWPQSTWDHALPVTERAARNTHHLLDLLAAHNVRATMFVLGLFAEKFPDIVKRIHQEGHEVGCHTYGHVEVFLQTPQELAETTGRCKDVLEQLIGERVRGYRAADFSIVRKSLWGLDVLAELGFDYDSSIFPVDRSRYGIPDWPRHPTMVELQSGRRIMEFPIASYHALRKNWPVGGGGYHRLLPGWISRMLARRVLAETPFVFYCHPYEFDPREFAEINVSVPWRTRLHQGLGRGRFERRFAAFLKAFGGRRFVDLIDEREWPSIRVADFAAVRPAPPFLSPTTFVALAAYPTSMA
jgi:polysaccharide deacetylase family protein (PEP-CTERM system associated)